MRLRELYLRRYRQFVDQRLKIDPLVTVIVGRNDSGKTGLLGRFFDQYVLERAPHPADGPLALQREGADGVAFTLSWDVAADDYTRYPLADAFGPAEVRRIEVEFNARTTPGEQWVFRADGEAATAYEGEGESRWPILRPVFGEGNLFPRPHFISIGERRLIPRHFEARFHELAEGEMEVPRIRDHISLETLLLRLAGFRAHTRVPLGKGTEEPWDTPAFRRAPNFAPGEVNDRLAQLATRITRLLRDWWDEPPDLTFRLRLVTDDPFNYQINSHLLEWSITDSGGTSRYGAGLTWFVAFAVELLYLEDQPEPRLVLVDEPATPLHPGMQKKMARWLGSLAKRHQVIYSTHSPFLIDWSFPQRLRLFEHDYDGKVTTINNRPHADQHALGIWDPLRRSVGITLGDVTGLSPANVLVEGVTDQILLANASEYFAGHGRAYLDLARVSIVPYGDELELRRLIAMIRNRGYRGVVVADSDDQGKKVVASCQKASFPCIELRQYAAGAEAEVAAIEDVVGLPDYVHHVNEFYQQFAWFEALDPFVIRKELVATAQPRTLGKYLEDEFSQRFAPHRFAKVPVAIEIANRFGELSADTQDRFERLVSRIQEGLR